MHAIAVHIIAVYEENHYLLNIFLSFFPSSVSLSLFLHLISLDCMRSTSLTTQIWTCCTDRARIKMTMILRETNCNLFGRRDSCKWHSLEQWTFDFNQVVETEKTNRNRSHTIYPKYGAVDESKHSEYTVSFERSVIFFPLCHHELDLLSFVSKTNHELSIAPSWQLTIFLSENKFNNWNIQRQSNAHSIVQSMNDLCCSIRFCSDSIWSSGKWSTYIDETGNFMFPEMIRLNDGVRRACIVCVWHAKIENARSRQNRRSASLTFMSIGCGCFNDLRLDEGNCTQYIENPLKIAFDWERRGSEQTQKRREEERERVKHC